MSLIDAVIEVNLDGTWQVYAGTMLFPKTPVFFNDIDVSKMEAYM